MWAELKKRLSIYHPIPKEDLWKVVEKEWHEIPNEYLIRLYESLPRCLRHVLRNKGLNSKY